MLQWTHPALMRFESHCGLKPTHWGNEGSTAEAMTYAAYELLMCTQRSGGRACPALCLHRLTPATEAATSSKLAPHCQLKLYLNARQSSCMLPDRLLLAVLLATSLSLSCLFSGGTLTWASAGDVPATQPAFGGEDGLSNTAVGPA